MTTLKQEQARLSLEDLLTLSLEERRAKISSLPGREYREHWLTLDEEAELAKRYPEVTAEEDEQRGRGWKRFYKGTLVAWYTARKGWIVADKADGVCRKHIRGLVFVEAMDLLQHGSSDWTPDPRWS